MKTLLKESGSETKILWIESDKILPGLQHWTQLTNFFFLLQAHAEEIDHLKKTSQQLKSQLEGILHKK
jgi:hypothetical protein